MQPISKIGTFAWLKNMRPGQLSFTLLSLVFCLLFSSKGYGKVDLTPYGLMQQPAAGIVETKMRYQLDSLYKSSFFSKHEGGQIWCGEAAPGPE